MASSFVLEKMFLVYFSVIQSFISFLPFNPPKTISCGFFVRVGEDVLVFFRLDCIIFFFAFDLLKRFRLVVSFVLDMTVFV